MKISQTIAIVAACGFLTAAAAQAAPDMPTTGRSATMHHHPVMMHHPHMMMHRHHMHHHPVMMHHPHMMMHHHHKMMPK